MTVPAVIVTPTGLYAEPEADLLALLYQVMVADRPFDIFVVVTACEPQTDFLEYTPGVAYRNRLIAEPQYLIGSAPLVLQAE